MERNALLSGRETFSVLVRKPRAPSAAASLSDFSGGYQESGGDGSGGWRPDLDLVLETAAVPGGGTSSGSAAFPSPWPTDELIAPGKKQTIAGVDQTVLVNSRQLADADSRFAGLRGVELHYKLASPFSSFESEDEEAILGQDGTLMLGTPTILIHGFGASLFSWERILRPIASLLGASALAFDRPAFGLSSRLRPPAGVGVANPEKNPYSLQFSADAVLGFIDHVCELNKSKRAILIAHSAGCLVAAKAALDAPETVAAMVFVSPAIVAPLIPRAFPIPDNPEVAKQLALEESEAKRARELEEWEKNRRSILRHVKWLGGVLQTSLLLLLAKLGMALLWLLNKAQQIGRQLEVSVDRLLKKEVEREDVGEGRKVVLKGLARVGMVLWAGCSLLLAYAGLSLLWFSRNLGRGLSFAYRGLWTSVTLALAAAMRTNAALNMVRTAMDSSVKALAYAWHDVDNCTDDVVAGYTKPLRCRNWDRAMVEFVIATALNPNLGPLLHKIQCPVLVVTGDDDRLVPVWSSEKLASSLPLGRFRVIKNCGHLAQEERPHALVEHIRQFLLRDVLSSPAYDYGASPPTAMAPS